MRVGTAAFGRTYLLLLFTAALSMAVPARALAQETNVRLVTLSEVVDLAVRRSPATVSARADVTSARAGLLQARGSWLPSVTLNGVYGNSSNQRFDQTTGQLVSENYTTQLQGSYELFTGGRRWLQQRAAGAGVDAAEAGQVQQRFATVLTATQSFYEAAAAGDLLTVAQQRVERARQQLDFARTRLELGTATASDELQAGIELANAEMAALEAESAQRAAVLALARVMGVEEDVRPAPGELPDHAPPLPPLASLVQRAERSSPAVLAADASRASARAQRLSAMTPYLPSVRITGGYDWFSYQFPPGQQSWSLRLYASFPVFNGFQREASLERARAAANVAEARARDARIATRAAVETARHAVELAERRVQISGRTLALARENLRVQEERYRIGNATILELEAAQVALAEADVAAVRARQALGGSVAELEAVLGQKLGAE
ncbi:MAG TPA: TolC family protein [Longimicrobiales bacterium]|nr:TolC family protein [Longimicrobiales bacterium]